MSLRVGMVIFQENNLLNELFLLHRRNFWDAPMKSESKMMHKLFI